MVNLINGYFLCMEFMEIAKLACQKACQKIAAHLPEYDRSHEEAIISCYEKDIILYAKPIKKKSGRLFPKSTFWYKRFAIMKHQLDIQAQSRYHILYCSPDEAMYYQPNRTRI